MKITTSRLFLRPISIDDFEASHKLLSDPEVMKFSLNGPYNRQKTTEFINNCIQQTEQNLPTLLAVIDRTTGLLIGYCGFYKQKINGVEELELGYRLAKEHWGKGLATEAALAMQEFAFNEMGLTRLISLIEKDNIASIRVAQKNGFKLEKEMLYDKRIEVQIFALERLDK
ncbi:MAG: GNAT family N-acetyltransferase [Psychromonas sp.]|nr:GNAT family N-acetyltransferase [Alteromonadales bacterium]MCP5079802.1 GNAT family N-acetyltransferase [Psychromonas sp.]